MSRHKPFIALLAFILTCINAIAGPTLAQQVDLIILGDSNIWLAGDSCNNPTGWATWLKDTLEPRTCVSYARSGASWSHTTDTKTNTVENIAVLGDDNVIYNQVMRLGDAYAAGTQPAPDVILISAGGNDAWFASKRPLEFDQTVEEAFAIPASQLLTRKPGEVTSLPAAIRYCCLLLKATFPQAHIVVCTPTPMSKVEPEMLQRVSDIIEASAAQMDIPTLRLDKAGLISRDDELREHIHTYDGIHTNEKGAEKIGRYVAGKLATLVGSRAVGKCKK